MKKNINFRSPVDGSVTSIEPEREVEKDDILVRVESFVHNLELERAEHLYGSFLAIAEVALKSLDTAKNLTKEVILSKQKVAIYLATPDKGPKGGFEDNQLDSFNSNISLLIRKAMRQDLLIDQQKDRLETVISGVNKYYSSWKGSQKAFRDTYSEIRAGSNGVWIPKIYAGMKIRKGMIVGTLVQE